MPPSPTFKDSLDRTHPTQIFPASVPSAGRLVTLILSAMQTSRGFRYSDGGLFGKIVVLLQRGRGYFRCGGLRGAFLRLDDEERPHAEGKDPEAGKPLRRSQL